MRKSKGGEEHSASQGGIKEKEGGGGRGRGRERGDEKEVGDGRRRDSLEFQSLLFVRLLSKGCCSTPSRHSFPSGLEVGRARASSHRASLEYHSACALLFLELRSLLFVWPACTKCSSSPCRRAFPSGLEVDSARARSNKNVSRLSQDLRVSRVSDPFAPSHTHTHSRSRDAVGIDFSRASKWTVREPAHIKCFTSTARLLCSTSFEIYFRTPAHTSCFATPCRRSFRSDPEVECARARPHKVLLE